MSAAKSSRVTVCESPLWARVFLRVMTPLLAGASLLSAGILLFADPFRNADVPDWLHRFSFRGACAAAVLGFFWWMSSRVSETNAWIKLEGTALHVKRFWSGRVTVRSLHDVRRVAATRLGGFTTYAIEFKDGGRLPLEGRLGPGFPLLLEATRLPTVSLN